MNLATDMTTRPKIRFGIIGLGLMGREFASAVARWCHILDDAPIPEIVAICNKTNKENWKWYLENFPSIELSTTDYRELIESDSIDAIYCAVPHHLHEKIYVDIIRSGKHLLAEKPMGIDLQANRNILAELKKHPDVILRCSSEFPFYPGAQRIIAWIQERAFGHLIELRASFRHSSDMDLEKQINWKRMIRYCGAYGCMGDLGFHLHHIPFRMGLLPHTVFANLQNIVHTRPDGSGSSVACDTWDNATLICEGMDPENKQPYTLHFDTKRMSPGDTNTWSLELIGTEGAVRFSTSEPRTFYSLIVEGKEQGWTRTDIGPQSVIPSITGGIFEFGFSDAFQQMIASFMREFSERSHEHWFRTGFPEETHLSHLLLSAALESHRSGKKIAL